MSIAKKPALLVRVLQLFPLVSCSLAETATWTTSLGIGLYIGELQTVRERYGSLSKERHFKLTIYGLSVIIAELQDLWLMLLGAKLREISLRAEVDILMLISMKIALKNPELFCWDQPMDGFPFPCRFLPFRWKEINLGNS
jgi:hypothetical protein